MATNLFDLSGKIALVSGASRGIGEGIARIFAEQGAHVIVSSRKIEDCESIAKSIKQSGGSAETLICNVGRMEDILNAFEQIQNRHGKLDILVNNAAANPYFGHVLCGCPVFFIQKPDFRSDRSNLRQVCLCAGGNNPAFFNLFLKLFHRDIGPA